MNAWPACPVALKALVMTGAAWLTVRASAAVPVPPAFVALSPTENFPLAVGVPEMSPEVVFTLNPAGSPVAAKLAGVLLAAIW